MTIAQSVKSAQMDGPDRVKTRCERGDGAISAFLLIFEYIAPVRHSIGSGGDFSGSQGDYS
jgi:hypothetical protein